MECDDDGLERASEARGRSLKRKLGSGGAGVVRLVISATVPRAAAARAVSGACSGHRAAALSVPAPPVHKPSDSPFMNNMDEITYWVYTKRAPCLFDYDNARKKLAEQAQPSTTKPPSVKSKPDDEQSPRKKRKLKLDGNSASTEKQQNVYFKTPQNQKPPPQSCQSREDGSDADFVVKPPSTRKKPKTIKSRNCQSRVPKKAKVSTSTPQKAAVLRRSNRKAPQNIIDLDSSFENFNSSVVNGNRNEEGHQPDTAVADKTPSKVIPPDKGTTKVACAGQFEDLSDVSGFTANYIQSTKIHSAKRQGPKLRNPNSRAPSKHTKPGEKTIICQTKAVNTVLPDALNCSTDSSQNALNLLVTVRNNEKGARVNKSTSILKFVETKLEDTNSNRKVKKQESKCNLNISFQSRSSGASRYPRRHKNNTADIPEPDCSTNIHNSNLNTTTRRYNMRKGTLNSNLKENSQERIVSRTRSGRRRGMKLEDEESGSPVPLNSSIEPVSSTPAVNVACPNTRSVKKSTTTSRCLRSRTVKDKVGQTYKDSASEGSESKLDDGMPRALEQSTPKCVKKVKNTMDKSGNSLRDSLRDKSGFAACFSDSGSDSVPLKQKKFFC